mgnify:CR=1 FL=1
MIGDRNCPPKVVIAIPPEILPRNLLGVISKTQVNILACIKPNPAPEIMIHGYI